jgi:tetratricopeptide (TPR) repeat protein
MYDSLRSPAPGHAPDVFEIHMRPAEEDSAQLHSAFLERASDPGSQYTEHALGAFLVMRVVDQLGRPRADLSAVHQQVAAARGFIQTLVPRTAEVEHIEAVALAAESVMQLGSDECLWGPLARFACWLEDQLRLTEALDVLETSVRTAQGRRVEQITGIMLQRSRVLRRLGRFSESTASYAAAGERAKILQDTHSELLSRIGRGIVLQLLGNLPGAKDVLEEVRQDAIKAGDRDAEARATHDLAVTCNKMGEDERSVALAFQAFQAYEDAQQKHRALADLGSALQSLGHYSAANDAFEIVLSGDIPVGMRTATTLELLGLASLTGNRVAFERRRRELDEVRSKLPPSTLVDLEMKLGMGLASFDQQGAAKKHLERAIELAEEHNLNDFLFKAEAALDDLNNHSQPPESEDPVGWEDAPQYSEVARVARELHEIRVTV